LQGLTPKALRSEIGAAARLVKRLGRQAAFRARCRGMFGIGVHLQKDGKLLVERGGDEIGDQVMRTIFGSDLNAIIDHARARPHPTPTIRVKLDEASNARLLTPRVLRAAAENNSDGLYWEFLLQRLDVPGGADDLIQVCHRREWYGCQSYDLARKAAIDVVSCMHIGDDDNRAKMIQSITGEIKRFSPGWRYVVQAGRVRKEYVPLLQNPWPDWPGLRDQKAKEKLEWIHARPEYGVQSMPRDTTSPGVSPSPQSSSPDDSSPAGRWRKRKVKPADGSPSNESEEGST